MKQYFAAIEAGGTKFNCAIIDADKNILAETRIATTTPDETIGAVIDFFTQQKGSGFGFDRLGLATFGPVDLDLDSATYGHITKTPKPHWTGAALAPRLAEGLGCEVVVDTDVNGAALAEYRWGAAQGTSVAVYITVGTGVGGGVVINGKPLHGLLHPEIGHMLIGDVEGIKGVCPFHGSCIEGLASGTAMGKIWQKPAEQLPDDHRAWEIQARVLGMLCHNLMLNFSPEKIVLGGGVMNKPGLLGNVIQYTQSSLASYVTLPSGISFEDIICLPQLGNKAGIFGAFALVATA